MFSLQTLSQIAGLLPPRAYQPIHQAGHFAAAAAMASLHGVWMRGLLRESGKPAQLLVAGEPPWVNYLPQRLLRPGFTVEPIFRARPPMVPRPVDHHGQQADLVCVRMDHGWARLTLGPDYLRVPEWLGAYIDLSEDLESFLRAGDPRRRGSVAAGGLAGPRR